MPSRAAWASIAPAASRAAEASLSDRPQTRASARRWASPGLLAEADRSSLNSVATCDREAGRRDAATAVCSAISTPSTPPAGTKSRRVGTACGAAGGPTLCPHYRSGGIQPQRPRLRATSAAYEIPRNPGEVPAICRETPGYVHCCLRAAKALAAHGNGRYSGCTCHVFPSCCRFGGARGVRAECACARRPRAGEGAGRLRDQSRPERPLERSIVPMAEGGGARPHLLRRVEQPGDRLRAAGKLRGGPEGLREGRTPGSEEPDDSAELRSLQRNQ